MKFTIAIKLALLVTVVVAITAGVLGYSVNVEYHKLLAEQELKNIGVNTGEEAAEIITTIKRMNEDVLFLSSTPPIQGLIRANNDSGIDALDGSTEYLWKKRLAIIFQSYLEAKPHYQSIRYIGVEDNGKELVRTDRNKGKIKSYIKEDLQQKENRKYYKKSVILKRKEIYVSDIEYNREFGEIVKPHQLVMRSVTPVYSTKNVVFGVIVINIDVSYLFADFLSLNNKDNNNVFRYIVNRKGEILNRINDDKKITLDSKVHIDDFSEYVEWKNFLLSSETEMIKKFENSNGNIALYAKKIFLDKTEKNRFITLVEKNPYSVVVENVNYVKKQSLLIAIILLLPAILITVIFSNRFTRPLKNITNSITNYKKNRTTLDLNVKSNDEIGALATAFREMVHDLDQAQEQLIQSEKMASIGQLAAGVAHEINNPVGFVGSNINSLKDYCNDLLKVITAYESTDEYLKRDNDIWDSIETIKKEVDLNYLKEDISNLISESTDGVKRVKEIVQNLKDFSHVDEAEWQWADIHKGLDSTLNIVNNEIKYKAEVLKKYGEVPEIECLASQLNQVFMNLLVNAAHSIDEHGTITIETGLTDTNLVWICISDTGRGIPSSLLKKVFDPFFTTKPIGEGTGLGLSLSYGIIEKHAGRIDVESKEGVGTKFSIWLPVKHKYDTQEI